jgi:hypothetical protein
MGALFEVLTGTGGGVAATGVVNAIGAVRSRFKQRGQKFEAEVELASALTNEEIVGAIAKDEFLEELVRDAFEASKRSANATKRRAFARIAAHGLVGLDISVAELAFVLKVVESLTDLDIAVLRVLVTPRAVINTGGSFMCLGNVSTDEIRAHVPMLIGDGAHEALLSRLSNQGLAECDLVGLFERALVTGAHPQNAGWSATKFGERLMGVLQAEAPPDEQSED